MKFLVVIAIAATGLGWTSLARAESTPPLVTEGETMRLPEMQIIERNSYKDFRFPTKTELVKADLLPGSAPPNIIYPGQAFADGVISGHATVGVMLDARGQPTDYLLVRYTQTYFGVEVLEEAKKLNFAPTRLHGQDVPGTYHFTYKFVAPAGTGDLTSFGAMVQRLEQVSGGPKLIYEPHRENEIDSGGLEPVRLIIPVLPTELSPSNGQPVRVLVTFYVDEKGQVRLPNIESSVTPALVPAAIAALQQWLFKPPQLKGTAVLVQANRVLTFRSAPRSKSSR